MTLTIMCWLPVCKSKLSISNIFICKTPILTYGIQLRGTPFISNIDVLECFQARAFSMIVESFEYVSNAVIQMDLQTSIAEVRCYALNNRATYLIQSQSQRYLTTDGQSASLVSVHHLAPVTNFSFEKWRLLGCYAV
jgi:hypothetical protein